MPSYDQASLRARIQQSIHAPDPEQVAWVEICRTILDCDEIPPGIHTKLCAGGGDLFVTAAMIALRVHAAEAFGTWPNGDGCYRNPDDDPYCLGVTFAEFARVHPGEDAIDVEDATAHALVAYVREEAAIACGEDIMTKPAGDPSERRSAAAAAATS